ncbi:MAG: ankyrin repeat domain-containing protein [Nonlabens sp.]
MKKLLLIAIFAISCGLTAQNLGNELAVAMKNGDIATAKTYITETSVNECHQLGHKDVSMMVFILSMDNMELLKYAVEEKDADVNIVCGKYTPLTWAAKNGSAETVSYLLEQGADKSIAVKNKTAMDWAQYYKRTDIISLLN